MKQCAECDAPAGFSLVVVVSTVGRSKRKQGCSTAALLCDACLLRLLKSSDSSDLRVVQDRVNSAFTKLSERLEC
jgi:hypothetical protein